MHLKRIKRKELLYFTFLALIFLLSSGCNKSVQVPEPISSVTTAETFSTDANATAAMLGIYSYMNGFQPSFSSGYTTYYPGESADELSDELPGSEPQDNFLSNTLTPLLNNQGSNVLSYFWQPAYYDIYMANAVISGVQSSTGMTSAGKTELTGEAKFIRAFCYFYLTNLFGDLPLDLSTNFNQTVLLKKIPQTQIYQQIISDLLQSKDSLPGDFSITNGEPIRANKWAATALLARTYLYIDSFANAATQATAVINSGQFRLVGLDTVFLAKSAEAILQLQTPDIYPFSTWEGDNFLPYCPVCPSFTSCFLTTQLLGAFESNDLRRSDWVDSTNTYGPYYYYPYKYKVRVGSGYPSTENYTLLRLAEQYLIRAEAEANLNQLVPAINDLNTIRTRAGLDSLLPSLSQAQVLAAVQQEDRMEFFAEWGHRWFDLKRWGIALQTLDTISYKAGISSTQLLYPIPISEIQTDPNLIQNPGYQP